MNQLLREDKDEIDVALRKRCIRCWCSSAVEDETAVCSAVEDETAVGVFQSLKQSVVAKHSAVGSSVEEDTSCCINTEDDKRLQKKGHKDNTVGTLQNTFQREETCVQRMNLNKGYLREKI
ncbi:pentatricopeptide repeat-containing protein chloroplastic-like [Dorcoceras hygrometricum]|uniref:Pentatricopeptide repeat-containing protein chloroplastic-like n=1 Tax=Dorcoceras hygrometricum TaxID=472368 RepID=A0A2Z7BMR3_9LAMI|nr:pentatricopeptide repeat-containing protein chloroplastic-like [Dorcoceras hygrometricum]